MIARARIACASLTSAALALCGVSAATQPLTDSQLDDVSAGSLAVAVGAAEATGLFTIAETSTNAFASPNSGAAGGIALAVGTNLGSRGPVASASTNVQPYVTIDNPAAVVVQNVNYTTRGAGDVVLQVAWIYAYSPPSVGPLALPHS